MNQQKGGACIKRTLFSNLKELSIDPCPHIDQPQKYYAKSEKPVTKEHILSKSTDIKRPKQANRQTENEPVVPLQAEEYKRTARLRECTSEGDE